MINSEHPNIILIVIDALRARNLGCYVSNNRLSPHIDKIAQEGITFKDAYCCWNTTDPSLTSILTGKYPISHGITNHGEKITPREYITFDSTGTKTLPEVLHQYGYRTMAVDWMSRWFKRGFDYYGYAINRNLIEKIKYYTLKLPALYCKYLLNHIGIIKCYTGKRKLDFSRLIDDIKGIFNTFWFTKELAKIQDGSFVVEIAKELINTAKKEKFLLFLHFWDTHTPYNCPRKYMHYRGTDTKRKLISRYEGAVNYVDQQLGKLFAHLKENALWENTMIIITSDHGESLMEHNIFFDHHGLYEETTHVPLIIFYPKSFSETKEIRGFVQHVDLFPTILEILGIDSEQFSVDGNTLIPLIEKKISEIRSFVYNEESYVQRKRAIRTRKYKYITTADGESGMCRYCHKLHGGKEELYDLEKDPAENVNIINTNEIIAEELKNNLERIVNDLITKKQEEIEKVNVSKNNPPCKLDDIQGRKLRSLGYM